MAEGQVKSKDSFVTCKEEGCYICLQFSAEQKKKLKSKKASTTPSADPLQFILAWLDLMHGQRLQLFKKNYPKTSFASEE